MNCPSLLNKETAIDLFGFKAKMTEANEVIDRGQDVVKELRLLSKYVANVTSLLYKGLAVVDGTLWLSVKR